MPQSNLSAYRDLIQVPPEVRLSDRVSSVIESFSQEIARFVNHVVPLTLTKEWSYFIDRDDVRSRVAFLSDYDLLLTSCLVQGVDLCYRLYSSKVSTNRPLADYTARVIPWVSQASVPLEANQILWQK